MDGLEPIAIVGIALRFPGDAENVDSFWDILCNKRSTSTEIPKDRFNVDAFWHPSDERGGTLVQRKAHFLSQKIAAFDAGFFAVPPNEANSMDPQQRILLEVVYESLENAGITMEDVSSTKTACYVGAFTREYEGMMARDEENVSTYHATGNGMAMLANRISWFYNLKGPSLTLDTACSSSLTGLHVACQSLRNGESSMAILGGVNLFFNPDAMFSLTAMGFLSPDGQYYAFDHRANGYVRGEGFASVILEPLSAAIRNGHTIRAVIRSTGLNQDGHTPGITLPNGESQETLIRDTYGAGKIDMSLTRYFEAHRTGTPAGDPIEAGAIASAFETSKRSTQEPLFIGAVKSNIGHLGGTSGLTGLIKTICILEKGLIPPNTAFEKPNPRIPMKSWNIKFPLEVTPWPCDGLRRASVNSFGYGGSNAHAILDDAFNYLQSGSLKARHCTVTLPPRHTSSTNGFNDHLNDNSSTVMQKRVFVWSVADKGGEHEHQTEEWFKLLRDFTIRESLAMHLESTCADGRVMARMGPQLLSILRQETDALELMMQDDLLSDLYENGVDNEVLRTKLASYIDLLSFKNPEMNILEVGAGTGGTSLTVLKTLSKGGLSKLLSYTYTDISAGFFEAAKDKFGDWADKMTFQVLEIEKDPIVQGYEEGKFELVITSNVLHATSNLRECLQNVYKLLKPDGKLILFEICHPLLRNALSFGLLPGWWRSKESYRKWGPTITEPEWEKLLRDSGFNGIDFAIRDYEDPKNHHVSLIVSSAKPLSKEPETVPEVLIVTSSINLQKGLVAQLEDQLHASGYTSISSVPFDSLTPQVVSRKAILFVTDLVRPLLHGIEDEVFSIPRTMLTSASSVLWLSRGSSLAGSAPGYGLVVGLGRVIRAERNGFKFINFQLSAYAGNDALLLCESLGAVIRVFQETVNRPQGAMGEPEYSEKDGAIYIDRLVQAPQFNEVMSATHSARKAKPQPFGGDESTPQRALKLEISAPGMLSTLRFVEDEVYYEPLPECEIEVEVKAVGLNFRDVMIAMGQLSDTYLGDECAGIVTRVGASVKEFQVGDHVFGVAHGSFRTYYRDEARLFQKIPEEMGFESAAALPLVYCTAYYGLVYRARLRKGQSVLIHAAAGGVGQAAIVLAKRICAEIFVTVGTADKKKFIKEEYGIPEDHIFYSRDLSFSKG